MIGLDNLTHQVRFKTKVKKLGLIQAKITCKGERATLLLKIVGYKRIAEVPSSCLVTSSVAAVMHLAVLLRPEDFRGAQQHLLGLQNWQQWILSGSGSNLEEVDLLSFQKALKAHKAAWQAKEVNKFYNKMQISLKLLQSKIAQNLKSLLVLIF